MSTRPELSEHAGTTSTGQRRWPGKTSFTAGVAVGITITLAVAAMSGIALLSHTICAKRGSVGTTLFWTPYSLANAPYLGSSYYSANFQLYELFGFTNVTLKNGLVAQGNISVGYFETENWTLFSQANTSALGPGINLPCKSPYRALPGPTNFTSSVDGFILQGPGNTSNTNEPTSYPPASKHATAVFDDGFVSGNRPAISTCGTPRKELNFSSSSFNISLSISGPKGPVTAIASVASSEKFTYYFPANGGTWQVDDLQANPGLSGPGLAFDWAKC